MRATEAERVAHSGCARALDEIRPRLYLGSMAARALVVQHGVTHVLVLLMPDEHRGGRALPDGVEEEVVSMRDDDSAQLRAVVPHCLAYIEEALDGDPAHVVLVHCALGMSRSASVVIAWLMYREGLTREEAYDAVATKRPQICPRPAFYDQLGDSGL